MNFTTFSQAVVTQLQNMHGHILFVSNASKDDLWDTYLNSFPEGSNPIFKERTEHDCNCCKQFIRQAGGILAIVDNKLVSIWDIQINNPAYAAVAKALSKLSKEAGIDSVYYHESVRVGTPLSRQINEDGSVTEWNHFHLDLPNTAVKCPSKIPSLKGTIRTNKQVLERSINEISPAAVEIVEDLISQGSLYRGTEHTATIQLLKLLQREIEQADNKENYLWIKATEIKSNCAIRNTVIGTLLVDISEGVDLERAVKSFEDKVAPHNYKRPKSLVTQSMITKANETVETLGIADSLTRRFANIDDITINNVLFADRSVKKSMGVFDAITGAISGAIKTNVPSLDKVEQVSIEHFIKEILPKIDSMEVLVENKHTGNLVSLVAPVTESAPNILKWGNNFSWTYNGEVTDSIKERVKACGGNVTGDLRFSIQWNDNTPNLDDLDAHCIQPGNLPKISFVNTTTSNGGYGSGLDVDIVHPHHNTPAVENICFKDKSSLAPGLYRFYIYNFTRRSGQGFSAQIEMDGQVFNYSHEGAVPKTTYIADVTWDGSNFSIKHLIPPSDASKTVWGIKTQNFVKVKTVMQSPNHWDGEQTGNKHYMFMLDGCINPDPARGFYNEFLADNLQEHRKVFEVLGAHLKAPHTDNQLSGLGFSSTKKDSVVCRVSGSFNRLLQINF